MVSALGGFVGGVVVGAIVEDVAVLVDLDERRADVLGGALQDVFQMLHIDVDRAGGECRLGADGDADRADRIFRRAHRRALGLLALLAGRGILALGQAVDAVVEQQDFHVDVSADDVHEVIAADGQAVAVAGDHPDVEIGAGEFQAGGEGRRAAVDGVEAVGVHVVREPAGAADAGDEDGFAAVHAELGAGLSSSARGWNSRRSRGTSGRPDRWRSRRASGRSEVWRHDVMDVAIDRRVHEARSMYVPVFRRCYWSFRTIDSTADMVSSMSTARARDGSHLCIRRRTSIGDVDRHHCPVHRATSIRRPCRPAVAATPSTIS